MTTLEVAQRNYTENIRRIPWTTELAKQYATQNSINNANFDNSLRVYTSNVEQEVRGVQGVKAMRETAKRNVDTATAGLKNIPNAIDGLISQMDIGGIQNKIRVVEDQIKAEREKQNKSEELLAIRKEQSAALEAKYAANYHSSWLGLWRPLKDNTHVGLNVASVVFGLLALVAISFLVYSNVLVPAVGGAEPSAVEGASGNNLLRALAGGFRKGKRV
jgi:hypothetical protein